MMLGLTDVELQEVKEGTAAALRVAFSHEAQERDQREAKEWQARQKRAGQERKSNLDYVLGLDHLLMEISGAGLKQFLPRKVLGPLREGEVREFVTMRLPGEDADRRRAVILRSDGVREYEVGIQIVGGQRQRRTLHLVSDMGPVGLPALQWLLSHHRLRGTCSFDVFHRLHGDLVGAVGHCGLMIVRLEFIAVHKLRKGPWSPGGKNLAALRGAAVEFFESTNEHCTLFGLIYEKLVDSKCLSSVGVGSPTHLRDAWLWARDTLIGAKEGADVKTGRWFSWEVRGRQSHARRWLDCLVLLWMGFRRSWFKTLSDSPLLSRFVGQVPDDARPLPGEREGEGEGEPAVAEGALGGAVADDGPSEHAKTMASGREELRQRREKCVNQLRFALNLLTKPVSVRLWSLLCWVPRPLEKWFFRTMKDVKSRDGVLELRQNLCGQELNDVAYDLFCGFFSKHLAGTLDFPNLKYDDRSAFQQQNDTKVCSQSSVQFSKIESRIIPCTAISKGIESTTNVSSFVSDNHNLRKSLFHDVSVECHTGWGTFI